MNLLHCHLCTAHYLISYSKKSSKLTDFMSFLYKFKSIQISLWIVGKDSHMEMEGKREDSAEKSLIVPVSKEFHFLTRVLNFSL